MIERETKKLFPHMLASEVHEAKTEPKTGQTAGDTRQFSNWIMIACCVPMIIGAGLVLWGTGSNATWNARLIAIAPLAICLGAHLVVHKVLGHKCHSGKATK